MTYSYYMTMRPAMPGAMPKNGLREIVDDTKWGYCRLDYDRELTSKEIADYELRPAKEPEPIHYRSYTLEWIWNQFAWRVSDDRYPQQSIAYIDTPEEAMADIDRILDEGVI